MPCQSKGPREGDVDFMKVKTSQNLSTGCSKRKAVYDRLQGGSPTFWGRVLSTLRHGFSFGYGDEGAREGARPA